MNLLEFIHPDQIELDVQLSSSEDAFALIGHQVEQSTQLDADAVSRALIEREQLGSTSVGGGFAIPHCKLNGVDTAIIRLVRFSTAIEFSCPHGDPVQFFFVVLSPPEHPALHLRVLGQIARVLKSSDVRRQLLDAPDAAEVVAILERVVASEGS